METMQGGERAIPAPYTSAFSGFNYYPTSAFKRSASSASSLSRSGQRGADSSAKKNGEKGVADSRPSSIAGPPQHRPRAGSSPTLFTSGPKSGVRGLHSPDPIPASRSRRAAGKGDAQGYRNGRTPSPQAAAAAAAAASSSSTAAVHDPSAKKPAWNRSATPQTVDHRPGKSRRSSGKASRLSSPPLSESPGGVTSATTTPSAARVSEANMSFVNEGARRSFVAESPFLASHVSTDGNSTNHGDRGSSAVCVDSYCMHSRRSIAEFIGMQRELRRCYTYIQALERDVGTLQERLAAAEAALAEQDAQAEARLHEREKELLVEMVKREQEAQADAWARATAEFLQSRKGYRLKDGESETDDDQALENRRLRASASTADDDDDEQKETDKDNAEALMEDMRRTIMQLEDTVERERAERRTTMQELRMCLEERAQLQAHVRLLSAWKEEAMKEMERKKEEKHQLWGQKPSVSSTPPRLSGATTGDHRPHHLEESALTPSPTVSQTPLQKLLARSVSLSPSQLSTPAATDGAVHGQQTPQQLFEVHEAEAAERLVTIRRSATPPCRPAPTAPTGFPGRGDKDKESTGPTPECDARETVSLPSEKAMKASALEGTAAPALKLSWETAASPGSSSSLAVSEARCRELLRALMDKEQQIAEIAAERALHQRRLQELGVQ